MCRQTSGTYYCWPSLAILLKPTTCSANSEPVFVKDRAVKIRLLKQSKQSRMAFNNSRWNTPYWHFLIWREKLLHHMLNLCIPSTFIRWIQSFLNDRRTRVQFFNVFSSSWRFTQDLPQGSVLFPLLFLFYINNLAFLLNNDAVIALFADDVSILTTSRKKEDAEAAAQSLVNSVVIWIQEWKLNLNTDKSEVCPLSTWSKTALGILLSSLTLRKFASTLLLVSSV